MSRQNWTEEKLFSRLINNKSDRTYWDNIGELRKRVNENVYSICLKLIKSKEPKKRTIAVDILAQLGFEPRLNQKQSVKLFFENLKTEKDSKVLFSTLYAIGHNNEKLTLTQVEIICKFQKSTNENIRKGVVFALLSVDKKLAIDTLINLTNDRVSHIRDWATFGIGTQIERDNKTIRQALWNKLSDKHKVTKLEAFVGLAKRKDKRIKQKIIQELLSGENDSLLFDAIEELNDKEFLPILRKQLKNVKLENGVNSLWTKSLEKCIERLKEN
jgi:HEAT repeat protein